MNKITKCNSCNKDFKFQSHLERHKKNAKTCNIDKTIEIQNLVNKNNINTNTTNTINNINNINNTDNTDNINNINNINNIDNIDNENLNKISKLIDTFINSILLESNNSNQISNIITLLKNKLNIDKIIENININNNNNKIKNHICIGCNKKFSDRHSLFKHNKFNRCKGNTSSTSTSGTTLNDILNIDNSITNNNNSNNNITNNNTTNNTTNNITNNIIINVNPFGCESFKNIKVSDIKSVFTNSKTLIYNLCNLIYLKNQENMNFFKNNINKKIISFLTSNMEIQKISEVDFTYELKYLIKDWYIELLFHFTPLDI
jgi:hypothetical protein